jgi:signal transduction histidine kinase/ActR/RegA family two-component response regulator
VKLAPVSEALTKRVVSVAADEHISSHSLGEGWVCAVFERLPSNGGPLVGLATAREAALFPQRIFRDLPAVRSTLFVEAQSSIDVVMKQMDRAGVRAVAVVDPLGRFLGAATHESILTALAERQRELLFESERMRLALDDDRRVLSDWARRLADFNEAASRLFDLNDADVELVFRRGIEALTGLVRARYGAIGVLDDTGNLDQFLHVGLSPEEVAAIGSPPKGNGLLGVIIREGSVLRVEDVSRDPRSAGLPKHHQPIRNLLGVPIAAGGRVFGRVYLCNKADGLPFDDRDERVAVAFARMIAVILNETRESARRRVAEDALRNKAAELHAVVETLHAFLGTGDEDVARATLLRETIELTGSEGGFVAGKGEDGRWRIHVDDDFPWQFFGSPERCREIAAKGPTRLDLGQAPDSLRLAAVPVKTGQDPTCLIAITRVAPYSDDELAVIEALSYAAATVEAHQAVRRQQRLLEERLARTQRLEAMGQLAGGIAHDFNNLLTVVLGCAEVLLADLPSADPRKELARDIRAAAEKGAGLSGQLLAFARRQVLKPSIVDLNHVVRDISGMLRRLASEAIEVRLQAADNALLVEADSAQLEAVLMNVVANARDAMPDGGMIDILTSRDGGFASIEVRDTGVGMDEATLRRIFEPFFTTKADRGGSGLGLSTAYGIVHQSGGDISMSSELGRGSCCRIRLPLLADEAAGAEFAYKALPEPRTGAETILLVEDEGLVRDALARGLGKFGYRVLFAARPSHALQLVKDRTGPIDVLVTDMVMPEMSGADLAAQVRLCLPGIDVLLITGYAPDASAAALPPGAASMQKPFSVGALAAKLRELLDAPRSLAERGIR